MVAPSRLRLSQALVRLPLLLLVLAATPLVAQQGTVVGTVVDTETGLPLVAAEIFVLGAGDADAGMVLSDAAGQFRLQLAEGTYSLVAQFVRYAQARVDGVRVTAGATTTVRLELVSNVYALNPVIVIARRQEKALESPNEVVTIGSERIQERAVTSATEHVRGLPGVDISQTGLTQSNVVTRGFNNVFSGALLVMTDNRYASVPSLRFNAYNMIPASQLDVDRIEVLLGPAAALYGPNSANGVLHILTTSPLDTTGTAVSVTGGERSVFQTQFRTAHRLSETAGLKVSGQYFRGDDWTFVDPVEDSLSKIPGADPQIGNRDNFAERYGGELRLDVRPWDDGELIFNAGVNQLASSIELTGIGAGQALDWRYSYVQVRARKDRLFGQVFYNTSDAGDTYILRTGQSIIDRSYMLVGQLQHGFEVAESHDFIYGLDVQLTEPRTEGTITGRNEDDDRINELGGYLHARTALSEKVDLVGALRMDYHNRLEDLVFSPRAALLFKPDANQTVRVTFNRAFSTPTTNNLFLDLLAARIPLNPQIGYDVRTLGVPETGFTFAETCQGGLQDHCMYSPFSPGTRLPANAAVLWDGLVQALVPAQLQPFLLGPGTQVGDPALGSRFLRFNQEALTFLPDDGPEPIERMKPTISNTFEVGYKGLLGSRMLVSGAVYSSQIKDFVGPLRVETPSVFYTPESVQAFVLHRLGPLIQAQVVSQEQAAQIIQGFAQLPVGTVAPDQLDSSDLMLTYRNFGDVDLWGADFAFQFLATNRVSLTGSYSHVSDECFRLGEDAGAQPTEEDCDSPLDIALNAPRNKGSLGLRWEDKISGITAEGRVRFTDSFPMNSGVYTGTVDRYTVFDANVAYRFRNIPGATVSLTATNLFDDRHQEFVGAPEIGRLLLVRLQYQF
jgi:outer membrane receptor for ferrienterochelin and colicins